MSSGINAALVCFILCLLMHESITYPCYLDQHRAHQLHLRSNVPLSWQPGSYPHPRELLPANKLTASSRKMEGNWDTKSAQTKEEEHKGGKGREQMPCMCICWLLLDVLWRASTARAALPLLTTEHERSDKLSYTYSPFWPSQKLEIRLKQMSADQAGKTWPSLWQRRTSCGLLIPEVLGFT